MRQALRQGSVTPLEAGLHVQWASAQMGRDPERYMRSVERYRISDGSSALRRLEARKLLVRIKRGLYVPTTETD